MYRDEDDNLMNNLERKWDSKHKRDFIDRMERKLHFKERDTF